MTEREELTLLSAMSVSALAFAASWLLVTAEQPAPAEATVAEVRLAQASAAVPDPTVVPAVRHASTVRQAPVAGVSPAPPVRRRVVVVRRSRAS